MQKDKRILTKETSDEITKEVADKIAEELKKMEAIEFEKGKTIDIAKDLKTKGGIVTWHCAYKT